MFGIWDIVVGAVGQHLQLSLSRWPYTPTHGFLIGALLFGGASIQGTEFFTMPTFSQLVSFYDLMSFKGFGIGVRNVFQSFRLTGMEVVLRLPSL